VNISNLTVKGKDKGKDKVDTRSTITASCTATTFVLLDKPVPAKKGKPEAGKPAAKKVA